MTVSECLRPPDSKIKYSVLYVYFCSCVIILCYFTGIFYADVRQISMLFIDNKDSVYIYIYMHKTQTVASMYFYFDAQDYRETKSVHRAHI